ncbi:hypothetical protein C0992_013206 [Termitomyces sp. T32_za158]|nr:hypothetical protein C0992_013206 [Termitomyces sp. T32_za158]
MSSIAPPTSLKGARQRPPKPRLPLSAFSPPNSASGDTFQLPPSPTTTHPKAIIDANVIIAGAVDFSTWKHEAGSILGARADGLVLSLPNADLKNTVDQLEDKDQTFPSYLSKVPTSLSTVFNQSTPEGIASLRWALERGRPVDVDIQAPISDSVLESFEDIISKAITGLEKVPPIVLFAALSLFPEVYVKFLPPSWDAPTPPTPSLEVAEYTDSQQKKEWKRRIKMYLGPVMEAFGYQRIIFGSSPCPTSSGSSVASDWYELARESLAELGVEQDFVDAVFYGNAKKVYGMD